MSVVEDLLKNVPIPKMLPIEQSFDETHIPAEEIPQRIEEQLAQEKISGKLRPGMEVAITVGSRGVANIALIVRSIADSLKRRGVKPFAVPAMGSHGGATAEGQRRNAYHADGIIVLGRVKPHTGFRGPYESGLMKMMAIGLGKQFGAEMIHADGFGHFREYIPEYGKAILKHAPVLCGLAVLENAYDQTRELEALTPQEIIDREPELLLRAKSYMPRILFDSCDVLIVDRMGKDISGDGMDPNISGRFPTPYASGGIQAQRVAVLGLTEASHGNACGIGLADVTTRRLFEEMDLEQTYPNAITNTVVEEMKIPMILASDRLAIQMALKSCTDVDHARPRVVRIRTTLAMRHIEISEAMLDQARQTPGVTVLGQAADMPFDENGNLF